MEIRQLVFLLAFLACHRSECSGKQNGLRPASSREGAYHSKKTVEKQDKVAERKLVTANKPQNDVKSAEKELPQHVFFGTKGVTEI
ncbi:hypothetical protein P5G51_006385 [Virgibacillus sp. 179-BFC.A HS]|uniref:Secreted protein n=1 Tax=Tigheibacillus jepli TaxID=3035914 RepID=A0ABU5CGV7_9BACI|nr:hypothetical protein [Virgibacillus sp. 179-BFC.A HS]MDY0405074.1 hypothetical protein [Virgibacillus sp. 179-BFC.A HS]